MAHVILFTLSFLVSVYSSLGQINSEVVVPMYNDKYSELVKKLENGQIDIDYKAFRESFIESKQFKVAGSKKSVMDSLKRAMYSQMDSSNNGAIIKITKEILSIDYTDMMAHKILRQTYKVIGDSAKSKMYYDIQFGLLKSILQTGDGKTCPTGWHVIQIEEEYFILRMIGARFESQALDNGDGLCDRMQVDVKGEKKTYFFEITKVFEGYNK